MNAQSCLAPGARALCIVAAVLIGLLVGVRPGQTQDALLPLDVPEGNLVAIGVGAYPDYLGSNDYTVGAIPLARYQFWGKRDFTLIGNALNVNLLDVTGWRFGPSGMVRFGRSDVEDEVVRRVHEVDPSIDLGLFVGYTWANPDDPRKRVGARAWAL